MSPRKSETPTPPRADIEMPPDDYEPSPDELEEELSMPNLTLAEAKERFMRPFKLLRADPKKPTETTD